MKFFLRLQENWDSYGASVIQERTVREASSFVEQLDADGLEIFFTEWNKFKNLSLTGLLLMFFL